MHPMDAIALELGSEKLTCRPGDHPVDKNRWLRSGLLCSVGFRSERVLGHSVENRGPLHLHSFFAPPGIVGCGRLRSDNFIQRFQSNAFSY
jgi:hypothetical protein